MHNTCKRERKLCEKEEKPSSAFPVLMMGKCITQCTKKTRAINQHVYLLQKVIKESDLGCIKSESHKLNSKFSEIFWNWRLPYKISSMFGRKLQYPIKKNCFQMFIAQSCSIRWLRLIPFWKYISTSPDPYILTSKFKYRREPGILTTLAFGDPCSRLLHPRLGHKSGDIPNQKLLMNSILGLRNKICHFVHMFKSINPPHETQTNWTQS